MDEGKGHDLCTVCGKLHTTKVLTRIKREFAPSIIVCNNCLLEADLRSMEGGEEK